MGQHKLGKWHAYHYIVLLLVCFFFKIIIYLFILLFLAVLGLCFCTRAFSSCGKRGPLFIAVRGPLFISVHGPLAITASLVAEHRLQTCRLSSCGSRAQLLRSMWDLPRPGLKPTSPALAGGLSTTVPPGKPSFAFLTCESQPTWKRKMLSKKQTRLY